MNLKQYLKEESKKLITKKLESKDNADPIIDPHQDQEKLGSGPPAFGLPPSGKPASNDTIRIHEVGQQDISGAEFSPAVGLMDEPKEFQKLYVDHKPLPEEEIKEDGAGGFGGMGIGHVKDLWKFTKPPVNKTKEVDELSAGGAGFVTTGPRNYGIRPPGPNSAGPSPMESKKYEFIPKKVGENLTLEIQHDGKTLHTLVAKSKEELAEIGKEWIANQKKEKKIFKKMLERFV